MEEVKKDGTNIINSDSADGGAAVGAFTNPAGSLFSLLDRQTQGIVVLCTYSISILLGATLAILAFQYEFAAQTQHLPFEMRDWMIAIISALLSLPIVGAVVHANKSKR